LGVDHGQSVAGYAQLAADNARTVLRLRAQS
jgi:hypothetical protein